MFLVYALLQIDIPNEDFLVVRVRGYDSSVQGPAFETIYFSRMDQYFCHFQLRLLSLPILLVCIRSSLGTTSCWPIPAASSYLHGHSTIISLQFIALVSNVDLGDSQERSLTTEPFLVIVFIVETVLICSCPKEDLLAYAALQRALLTHTRPCCGSASSRLTTQP